MKKIIKYDDFIQAVLLIKLINAGQSNLSDKQDEIMVRAYDVAFQLLSWYERNGENRSFERILSAVEGLEPKESMKSVMKHPEMYEKMRNSCEQFKLRIAQKRSTNKDFNALLCEYEKQCVK